MRPSPVQCSSAVAVKHPNTFALCIVLSTGIHAQQLTNAEVFDFEPGDVFQTVDAWCASGCSSCPPFLYVRDSVINKQFGVGGYEVLYTFSSQRYRAPGGPFQAEDTTVVYDFGYALGTDVPIHYGDDGASGPNCLGPYVPTQDTLRYETAFCANEVWFRRYEPCDTCFCFGPPSPWTSRFVRGAGGPYYDDNADFPTDVCFGRYLIYFVKDGVPCGNEIAMGMNEADATSLVTLCPNPAVDRVVVNGATAGDVALFHNSMGQMVLRTAAMGTIDLNGLQPGHYTVTLLKAGGAAAHAPLVKH